MPANQSDLGWVAVAFAFGIFANCFAQNLATDFAAYFFPDPGDGSLGVARCIGNTLAFTFLLLACVMAHGRSESIRIRAQASMRPPRPPPPPPTPDQTPTEFTQDQIDFEQTKRVSETVMRRAAQRERVFPPV